MHVLIATGLYAPDIGGPATYVTMLESMLPDRGVALTVVPFSTVRSYPKIIRHIVYMFALFRAAKKVDVVFALDPVSVGLPALIVSKLCRKPLLLRLGGDYAWEQGRVRFGVTAHLDNFASSITKQPMIVRCLAYIQSLVAKQAQIVIVPSNYLKQIVCQWGVAPDTIQVIYSTLSPIESTSSVTATKQKYGVQTPVLVTAGRLVPWKGMVALVAVIKELITTYPQVQLLIVGDGPQYDQLHKIIGEQQLQSHVQLPGRLDTTELANVIAAADVFVLNTAYEGLSHQLLEVMSLSTPIVTTDVGGNPELLTDELNALLVQFNNQQQLKTAINRLLTNRPYANQLTQTAKLRSKDFGQTESVTKLIQLFETVCE